jgi:hypothetical protein
MYAVKQTSHDVFHLFPCCRYDGCDEIVDIHLDNVS